MKYRLATACAVMVCLIAVVSSAEDDLRQGYYRQPALFEDTLVFVSEGDLWRVGDGGGAAVRLTTHANNEARPVISPDGSTVAFVAAYEGPAALYTMPLAGGRPTRWTWDHSRIRTVGWTPDGRLLYSTDALATLPDMQLVELDVATGDIDRVPLAQADDGCYDESGTTLFFTRYRFQGSHTKRYHGGTAQRLWRFSEGDAEAVPLTQDHSGTSRDPMCWQGRVFFLSDRDGTKNLWSMTGDGSDLRQHTKQVGLDVLEPSLSQGRIAYRFGADIRILDLATGDDSLVPIQLVSDFDQTRENWVEEPLDYLTAAHISKDGERAVLTARGQVFVAPRKQGRFVEATQAEGVRFREARFMPDGKKIVALSDESGEVELWTLPANGVGDRKQLTKGGEVLRWEAVPSPDGKFVAHDDKNYQLWIYDVSSGVDTLIASSDIDGFGSFTWSPDNRWLAYMAPEENLGVVITLHRIEDGLQLRATTDRYASFSPAFSSDGKWLYFLSNRHLKSVVRSPWGPLQPEPYFDKQTKIYALALEDGLRSPFQPDDELVTGTKEQEDEKSDSDDEEDGDDTKDGVRLAIDTDGLASRLYEVPVPPANSSQLQVNSKALFWTERDAASGKRTLKALKIENKDPKVETVAEDIQAFELSGDGKKILIRSKKALHIVKAKVAKAKLDKDSKVDLSHWDLSVIPQREWRQMFVESWRLERDYFYDRGMHGVDWPGMLDRYLPLVDRVRTRGELSDLMAQMASELAAIHTFVYGGDHRDGDDDVAVASLGARMVVDADAGGWRVDHVYLSDPDEPERRSPLAAPTVDVAAGDVITAINGVDISSDHRPAALLRNQVGRQVLMTLKSGTDGGERDVVVVPISSRADSDLRYHEWEYTRRLAVEEAGGGDIGYLHLRAMGAGNIAEWARGFYPVFNRSGLILDVRHNRGGNIDSWIIEKLMRKAWAAWSDRVAKPTGTNMQYAFRGHLIVLCDAWTASDGEAVLEGIRRLGLAPIMGIRTWGGGIWLTSSNRLVDGGIATAAEFGLFGPDGVWVVEGDGITPDIEVDNLPHATFAGKDAQLDAAIEYLKQKIADEPIPPLVAPPAKDLSLK